MGQQVTLLEKISLPAPELTPSHFLPHSARVLSCPKEGATPSHLTGMMYLNLPGDLQPTHCLSCGRCTVKIKNKQSVLLENCCLLPGATKWSSPGAGTCATVINHCFSTTNFSSTPFTKLAQVVTEEFQVSQLPGQILKQSCVRSPIPLTMTPLKTVLGIPGETLSPEFPTPKPKKNCETTHLPPPHQSLVVFQGFRVH